ncbi:Uncharacterized membrane protein YeiB [Micromonospora pallida]|uniref:Uncharacterized membrane protein YeiB n=1 Tax=Micromonospora pallida TaxID=145854 RepID=A0A1C6TH81_9ACTN|nr:DUF418 domain-containing protein [Micromonospora pallida]SCL40913.1 Uncharacterized membrane protein YeiB [Micromonospora pallida]
MPSNDPNPVGVVDTSPGTPPSPVRPQPPSRRQQTTGDASGPRAAGERIVALDVLRGFALCGILLANVKPIAHRDTELDSGPGAEQSVLADILHVLVDQRFFPIFSLLFGIGFSMLLRSARARTDRPRTVLARRLSVLLLIGLVHLLGLWRGDVLTAYAAVGLLVLLPSTWLPRAVVAALGGVLTVLSLTVLGGWYSLIPGLFLLGSALTRYGVIEAVDRAVRGPVLLGLAFALGAVPAVLAQLHSDSDPEGSIFRIAYPTAGLLLAGVYVCGLLLLLRTPLRGLLTGVLAPLGRMALTNYLSATVLVLAVASLVPGSDTWSAGTVVVVAGAILALQWLWSVLWLRWYRQGPVEWLWRWATWWQRPPLRRAR